MLHTEFGTVCGSDEFSGIIDADLTANTSRSRPR